MKKAVTHCSVDITGHMVLVNILFHRVVHATAAKVAGWNGMKNTLKDIDR